MKIGIVLNFNNYKSTLRCTNNLIKSNIDKVIIVDNASTNNSFFYLENVFKDIEKVDVICSRKNSGYASGNNVGLYYVKRHYGNDNIIYIVNPDTIVNEEIIDQIALFIRKTKNIGMVTTKMNGTMENVWHRTGLIRGFFFNLWFVSHLLYKLHITEAKHYRETQEVSQPVDVVMGAFFGIDQNIFNSVGFFDEKTFLYYEEEILSCKLRAEGYQNYILTNYSFKHKGQGTTRFNRLKIKKINDKSRLYYLVKYNNANKLYVYMYRVINRIENSLLKIIS